MKTRTLVVLLALVLVLAAAGGLAALVLGGGPADPESGGPDSPDVQPADAEPDRLAGTPKAEPEKEPSPADPPPPGAAWIVPEGFEEPLAAIDWPAAGTVMRELVPLLAAAGLASIRADEIREGDARRAGQLRERLAQIAMATPDAFRSVEPAGAVTHPAFAANLAAATLHARNAGLSQEQLASLAVAVDEALVAEGEAASVIDTAPIDAVRLVDEYDRRKRFYVAVDALLTEKQRTALHAAVSRNRTRLDPFSPAVLFEHRIQTIAVADAENVLYTWGMGLISRLGFGPDREPEALELIRTRIAAMDDDLMPRGTTYTAIMGFVDGDLAARWTRYTAELVTELIWGAARGGIPKMPPDIVENVMIPVWDPTSGE